MQSHYTFIVPLVILILIIKVFGDEYLEELEEKRSKPKVLGNVTIGDNIWPYPQTYIIGESFFTIDSDQLELVSITEGKCDLLDKAIARYGKLLLVEDCSLVSDNGYQTLFDRKTYLERDVNYRGKLVNITVRVNGECEDKPHSDMNEKYSIDINGPTGEVVADSVWGAIRALETLSQLVENVGQNQFIVNSTAITDFPRFGYRGLLLDTSRHYIPIERLEQSLDAMSYNKLNVFHWHIVDDQSFPYVSEVLPELSLKGAFNPKTHIYTKEDIEHIIDYANQRGIRVLVEFDTPGHTLCWGKGQPGLLTPCYTADKPNGNYGPIDPTKESSYQFIRTLFQEVVNRFPDQYLHLGADEVDYNCWRSNPHIIEFLKSNGFLKPNSTKITKKTIEPFAKLEEYYIQKVIEIVRELNRSSIVWQEVFENKADIKSDTIVHIWKLDNWQNVLFNVTTSGFQSILSSCWYINKISYGTDWHKYYNCDPHDFKGTEQQNRLVIGGEATTWGEWVDASNIIGRTWPRAIAVAERLWSSKETKDWLSANRRFNRQHCLMQKRGLRVEPSNGVGWCQCDYVL